MFKLNIISLQATSRSLLLSWSQARRSRRDTRDTLKWGIHTLFVPVLILFPFNISSSHFLYQFQTYPSLFPVHSYSPQSGPLLHRCMYVDRRCWHYIFPNFGNAWCSFCLFLEIDTRWSSVCSTTGRSSQYC